MRGRTIRALAGTLAVSVGALTLAACAESSDAPSAPPSAGPATPTSAPSVSATPFEVVVGGLTIFGHCSGERPPGAPAVILQHGNGGMQRDLIAVETYLNDRTMVCAYDRPGPVGRSPAPSTLPRSITEVVSETHEVLAAAGVAPPYFIVGHSGGGTVAFMFAQAYPDETAGFVSMNPVPPYDTWIAAARLVETPEEIETLEEAFYQGANAERTEYTASSSMMTGPLPATIPYAVMFDEDCDGDTEFCGRVLEPLSATTELLAGVGEGGRFVWLKGAGHELLDTARQAVLDMIDEVWAEATGLSGTLSIDSPR